MFEDKDYICYNLLMEVFRDNAYASLALDGAADKCRKEDLPYVTKLFYGVLERSVYYDYVLGKFGSKKPKKPIATLVKMGYYLLENMSVPAYAAVDNIVKLSKRVGKGGAAGFINSALRSFAPPQLPKEGTAQYLSVKYSYPLWLTDVLIGDYGYQFTRDMLSYVPDKRTHIRVNTASVTPEEFDKKYGSLGGVERSAAGYFADGKALDKIPQDAYVVQSLSSIAAVYAYVYGLNEVGAALDLCAAPGGKAVLLSSLTNARVTACDIHPHRVDLIRKYAARCSQNVTAVQNDATVFRPEWENRFDLVVCDVPCSGMGVVGSKPDILFNRTAEDITELTGLQHDILSVAAKYVKSGGRLCYSTCSVLRRENDDTVRTFLGENKNFERVKIATPLGPEPEEKISLFSHLHGTDGFFVAAMKKKD